jgi:hypothetical protein
VPHCDIIVCSLVLTNTIKQIFSTS